MSSILDHVEIKNGEPGLPAESAFSKAVRAYQGPALDTPEHFAGTYSFYGPYINCKNSELSGFESLTRVPRAGQKPGSPQQLFKEHPADKYLSMKRLEDDCILLSNLRKAGYNIDGIDISVNFSKDTFMWPLLRPEIQKILKKYDISPVNISIEIIEEPFTEAEKFFIHANTKILHKDGHKFKIDDYLTKASDMGRVLEFQKIVGDDLVVKFDQVIFNSDLYTEKSRKRAIDQVAAAGVSHVIFEGLDTGHQCRQIMKSFEEHTALAYAGMDVKLQGWAISRELDADGVSGLFKAQAHNNGRIYMPPQFNPPGSPAILTFDV